MGKLVDLTGNRYGQLKVIRRATEEEKPVISNEVYWVCKCDCENIKVVRGKDLKSGKTSSCGHKKIYPGQVYGELKVVGRVPSLDGRAYWECECSCTKRIVVSTKQLSQGKKDCGHSKVIDETGNKYGQLEVIRRATKEECVGENKHSAQWVCRCSCNRLVIVPGTQLRSNNRLSCGKHKGIDETDNIYGELKVIRRIPYTEEDIRVDGNARWLCECSCGKYKVFNGGALRSKSVTSCGHTRGEAALLRALRGKTEQQQLLRTNNEAFKEALESFENVNGRKPNSTDVGLMLGTDYNTALAMTKARGFEYLVSKTRSRSALEIDIQTKICANKSSEDYIINDRDTLGSEIDIYFPDCKLGVEVNGDYWHSELQKSKNYHQDKSILAAKNGILLFHIFEHEWRNERTRDIITGMLMNKINGTCATKIYARECSVRQISAVEAKAFNELWHIDGHANHRVAFGLFYRNELVSLMSFGISRFGDKNSVELIRYTTRYDIGVTGGAERLLKAFRDIYNGEIVTYCDIAKSDGSVYKRLGFTLDKITVPGYVWFEQSRHDVLTRYQCQKRNLVKHGLGDNSMTEDDIMHSLGYVKIYDCGNYKFILK